MAYFNNRRSSAKSSDIIKSRAGVRDEKVIIYRCLFEDVGHVSPACPQSGTATARSQGQSQAQLTVTASCHVLSAGRCMTATCCISSV